MQAMVMDFSALIGPMPCIAPIKVQAQGSGWTGDTKRIWLLLYTEGGWWAASEISGNLRIAGKIGTALAEMVDRSMVIQRRATTIDGENQVQYGVTRVCRVPRGVTVDEMWTVLQAGPKQ